MLYSKKENILQNTDRICTRIDRFLEEIFERWEKKPRVIPLF